MTEAPTPELELIFRAAARVAPPTVLGPIAGGVQCVVPILGGTFEGPNIRGTIVEGGADWQMIRADGVAELNAQYLLCTDDGVHIKVRNRGLRHGAPGVMERLRTGQEVDPRDYYFRTSPVFSAPSGKYEWLNRHIFLCAGARFPEAVRLWFYKVT